MDKSLEFAVGELTSTVKTLTREVISLRLDIENLKLFRSKVLGAALAGSALVSLIVGVMERLWAR